MNRQIIVPLISMLILLVVFHWTDWDIAIQDCFYKPSGGWMIDRNEPVKNWMFYTGPKLVFGIFGGICFMTIVLGLRYDRFSNYRNQALLMSLSMVFVPSSVALLKQVSGVYTPNQIKRYGGSYEYRKPFEYINPEPGGKSGRGFPAGHASGGFALMMLYFIFRSRRARLAGLMLGIITGWIMGMYQTLNGQHFFSHTPITMLLAWCIILVIVQNVPATSAGRDY